MKPTEAILSALLIASIVVMVFVVRAGDRKVLRMHKEAQAYADTIASLKAQQAAHEATAAAYQRSADEWRAKAEANEQALKLIPKYGELRKIIPSATDAQLARIVLWQNL